MNSKKDTFDDIRPYEDSEVSSAIARLLADKEFIGFIAKWRLPLWYKIVPWVIEKFVHRYLAKKLASITTVKEFQRVVEVYATLLVRSSISQYLYQGLEKLDPDQSYLFISNHRDIAGDSMLLNYALYHSGLDTVRIAVGDNLVQRQFATDLMKLNKSFFIRRSIQSAKKLYAALLQSSRYIASSLEAGQSVWIAQSEGRAKDGIDLTDPAVIKMITLAHRKEAFSQTIANLKLVPMSLSYEFDPCDELKAKELTAIEQSGNYTKSEGEDLLSLVQGLAGFKGQVVLRLGEVLEGEFQDPESVAAEVDRQIIDGLQLFPINYWALSKIDEQPYQALWNSIEHKITSEDQVACQARYDACDQRYRLQWLKMYANPVMNKHHKL